MSSSIHSDYVPRYEGGDYNENDEISNLTKGIALLAASIIIPLGFELMSGYPLTFAVSPALAMLAVVCAVAGVVYVILGLTEGDFSQSENAGNSSESSKSSFHLHLGGNGGGPRPTYHSTFVPPVSLHVPSLNSYSSHSSQVPYSSNYNPPSYNTSSFPSSSYSSTSSASGRGEMGGHYQSTSNPLSMPSSSFSSYSASPSNLSHNTSSSSSSSSSSSGRGKMGGSYQSSTTNAMPASASVRANVGGATLSMSGRGVIHK